MEDNNSIKIGSLVRNSKIDCTGCPIKSFVDILESGSPDLGTVVQASRDAR